MTASARVQVFVQPRVEIRRRWNARAWHSYPHRRTAPGDAANQARKFSRSMARTADRVPAGESRGTAVAIVPHVQNDATRTVMITGASAGVGRAAAREFAAQGWNVGLLARGETALDAAAREVEARGTRAMTLPVDVADADAVFAAAERMRSEWGRIDVWVNCAMVTVFGRARDVTPAEYARVTQVTYLGYVHGTLAALRVMRECNGGTIVQVGSALAYRAIPLQSAYCAAKFAVRGFTDSLRSELIDEGSRVRLTMVQLPAVNTPQFDWARSHLRRRPRPVAPVFQPETIAHAIYEAALAAPREVWLGRSTVKAIVADIAAPGLLDRVLARLAIAGQEDTEPARPERPDNLFAAVATDAGAHGRFDAEARTNLQAFLPSLLRLAIASCAVLALAAITARGRRPRLSPRTAGARRS
jgi:short-subunit dehydrogenase